MKMSQVSNKIG